METLWISLGAALAVAIPAIATAWAQSRIGAAGDPRAEGSRARHPGAAPGLPMVLRFPGPSWAPGAAPPEAWVSEILRRAVGYRVRLR